MHQPEEIDSVQLVVIHEYGSDVERRRQSVEVDGDRHTESDATDGQLPELAPETAYVILHLHVSDSVTHMISYITE